MGTFIVNIIPNSVKWLAAMTITVSLINIPDTSIAQEQGRDVLEFQFSDMSLLIDKSLVVSVGNRSKKDIGSARRFEIPVGDDISIKLPKVVTEAFARLANPHRAYIC